MENVSRSAAPSRDDTRDTRGIGPANQYDTTRPMYAAGPAPQFPALITGRPLDAQSSDRSNKKPRLTHPQHGREPIVRATAVPPRQPESTGVPRFLASIMDTTHSNEASFNGVPATWGPYSRSTHSSLPVMSASSGSLSRRGSGNTLSSPAMPSPAPSSGSMSRDGTMFSRHTSDQSQSPPSYTFTAPHLPSRMISGESPSSFGTSTVPHAAPPPVFNAVPVPPTGSQMVYTQPATFYGEHAGSLAQPSPYSSNTFYGNGSCNSSSSSNNINPSVVYPDVTRTALAPFPGPFRSVRQELECPGFVPFQPPENDGRPEEEGEWTSMLATAESDTFTENTPCRAVAHTTLPAALHNIINPVDDDAPFQAVAHQNICSNEQQEPVSDDASAEQNLQVAQTDKGARRPRSTFSFEKRQETSQTRTIGACLRCKSQRIRCVPSPEGPNGVCRTCQRVSQNSKKVLHVIHCIRWRLNEMSLYRHGGLNLTSRWSGTIIQDIADPDAGDIHEIEMKIFYSSAMHRYDLCPVPVKLLVRRFTPEADDVLVRKWSKLSVDQNGVETLEKFYVELPPYALLDANDTAETLRDYFLQNTMLAMMNVARSSIPVIRHHMDALIRHYYSLPDGDVEKIFLERFFRMWFCIRFTTGSSYISGPDKLGCCPVNDPHYPLEHRISVPRMITAQCDSIMVSRFLRPLATDVLNEFERFFRVGNPDHWFLLYACTFMLLHEVSFSSQDRHRHAVENWITDSRYSVGDFVKDLQFSANIILCYWHYYRTMDPTDAGWDIFCQIIKPNPQPRENIESAKGKGKKKVHVTREQCDLLMQHWNDMIEMAKETKTPKLHLHYEHPLYFVSQMYIKGWQVLETFDNNKK